MKFLPLFLIHVFVLFSTELNAGELVSLDLNLVNVSKKQALTFQKVEGSKVLVTDSNGREYGPFEQKAVRKLLAKSTYMERVVDSIERFGLTELLLSILIVEELDFNKLKPFLEEFDFKKLKPQYAFVPLVFVASTGIAVGSAFVQRHWLITDLLKPKYEKVVTEEDFYWYVYNLSKADYELRAPSP